MFKKSLLNVTLVSTLMISGVASAAQCVGKVTHILDWEDNDKCESLNELGVMVPHLAYFHTKAGGGNKWVCSNSDRSDSLIMMAYANQNSTKVMIPGATCNTPHYTKQRYLILTP